MNERSHDIISILRENVPKDLIDGNGWDRIAGRVGFVADSRTLSEVGLELRLSDPEPLADLFVPTGFGRPSTETLLGPVSESHPGSASAAMVRLLRQLSHENDPQPVSGCFSGAMLEYDIALVAADRNPEPGLWFRLNPERAKKDRVHEFVDALCGAVAWETGELAGAVTNIFSALPEIGRVRQIGALPDRTPRTVKLNIDRVPQSDISSFLERVGWPGRPANLLDALGAMEGFHSDFRIALDIGESGPAIGLGLELYIVEGPTGLDRWLTTTASDWRPTVNRMEELGWCLPQKARALLAYPGIVRLIDATGVYILYKGINHIKLTFKQGTVGAKAYAGYNFFRNDVNEQTDR